MLLDEALDLILSRATVLDRQMVPLADGFGRVCSENNCADRPLPGFDQSTRDGYAVCGPGVEGGREYRAFIIKGEIQAGYCHEIMINPGEAYRIMTGGLLPAGSDRVIPQEDCLIADSELLVKESAVASSVRYISAQGSECPAGGQLVLPGTRLNESHLARLADAGNARVEVFEQPRVAFFCSGTELVMPDDVLELGQKYSSNHLLLSHLVPKFGGLASGYGVVADDRAALHQLFSNILDSDADIVISTGGVGPGKYDLVGELLTEAGATILYKSLDIRPGKSTLFGILGGKLYFGLPGPPGAVRILFHELICPLIKKVQGMRSFHNQRLEAVLAHKITVKKSRVLCFKEGVYTLEGGTVMVGLPRDHQVSNCSIMMMPDRISYEAGDRVTISVSQSD